MYYDKQEYLNSMRNAYKKRLFPTSERMVGLKKHIRGLNRKLGNPGDYVQNKVAFKRKVMDKVAIPKTYLCTKNLQDIEGVITRLDEFVFKPNHLSRGVGVRVLTNLGNDQYEDINGLILSLQDLRDEARTFIRVAGNSSSRQIRRVMIEERIHSHPELLEGLETSGMVDIRAVYWENEFLFMVVRYPNSEGYGNICRGAQWGVVLPDGNFTDDDRFMPRHRLEGKMPFFNRIVGAGETVTKMFGFPLQAVDMTINTDGVPVVVESERLPQIEAYFTIDGEDWICGVVGYEEKTG